MADDDSKTGELDLEQIRKRINEIDERLQGLINDRANIAKQVGIAKGDLSSAVEYYRPEREAEVLRRVLDRNKGPLRDEEMLRLFREIMSACLAQQEPLKVGFLGPEVPLLRLPFTSTSDIRFGRSPSTRSTRCSRKWSAARPTSASCQSRILRKGP